ncbi:MAG: DPP IV N-terminal domain-containing protein [Anaerolineae bacterium]
MKTVLTGLFAVLVLASLLIVTIQAENTALLSSAAETPSLITVPAFAVSLGGNWLRIGPAGPVNLTTGSPANDQNPAWSPDGERILFTSGRSGNNELWVMDDDGSDPAALTWNGAENVNLPGRAWCPANDRIVFASDVESENDEIYSITSDGTDVQRLTTTAALNWEPSWAPDCSQIVFQSDRSNNWDIWRMNADGSNPVRLTDDPADDWEPNWSPDGTTIVFQSLRSGNWDLWTMDLNGGGLTNVTDDPAEDTDPSWSPDGEWIVYSSDRGGDDGDIWAIEARGGTPIQITDDPAYDGAPSWSPDGRRIAFESERSGNLDIWVVDAPCLLPGDLDGDGDVDIADVMAVAADWRNPDFAPAHDLDGDGDVDVADIMLVASLWRTAVGDPGYDPAYDLDDDGDIDVVDIMIVAVHWGETCE